MCSYIHSYKGRPGGERRTRDHCYPFSSLKELSWQQDVDVCVAGDEKGGGGTKQWLTNMNQGDNVIFLFCCGCFIRVMMFYSCLCPQGSFPGNLQLVLVLRPTTLFQRTISDILFKLNKDEFKMKVPVSVSTRVVNEERNEMN